MHKIRVVIVEDDPEWLNLMTRFLNSEEDIIVVATAYGKDDAIQLMSTCQTDIVLMDINLSGNNLDGIDAAVEISKANAVKIIMLTSLKGEEIITDSFLAGAANFVSKNDYRRIPEAIRMAYWNKSPVEVLLKDYKRLREEEQLKKLTQAEKEVYMLLEQGYSHTRIEKLLFKSESTLKTQINKILKKIGAGTSKEAIEKVKLKGLKKNKTLDDIK